MTGGAMIAAAAIGVATWFAYRLAPKVAVTQPITQPVPATSPATNPAKPELVYDALDLLRADDPKYPTTQPLTFAVELDDAARYVLRQPVRVDTRGDLWITDPRGQTLEDVIARPGDERTHVVTSKIVYAQWIVGKRGVVSPMVITPDGGSFVVRRKAGSKPLALPAEPRWDDVRLWDDQIVLPTRRGASIVTFDEADTPTVSSVDLFGPGVAADAKTSPPLIVYTREGIIAYAPWDDLVGGTSARYSAGKWSTLPTADGWSEKPLHLVPMGDDSILQVERDENKNIRLRLRPAKTAGPELTGDQQEEIERLVFELSSRVSAERQTATEKLTQMGPGIWPLLDKMRPDQPPEGQQRLAAILDAKLRPTLGSMHPLEGPVQVVARLNDGGVVLLLPGGVEQFDGSTAVPAWVTIRPGRVVERLSPFITADFVPRRMKLATTGNDWLVHTPDVGVGRFVGNHLTPLTAKPFEQFDLFFNTDASRRWLLKSSTDASATLVIDPMLPDPEPKLPTWEIVASEPAGWVTTPAGDLPALKRGGVWVLDENGWRTLDKAAETFNTPKSLAAAPTTAPAATQSSDPVPRCTGPDGTQYFGGANDLLIRTPDGKETTVPLPPEATGDAAPFLCATADRLFLSNYPGRLLRLKPDGTVEATFTHGIPAEPPDRLWLDPAGRIVYLTGTSIVVTFPVGRLPKAIREMRLGNGA